MAQSNMLIYSGRGLDSFVVVLLMILVFTGTWNRELTVVFIAAAPIPIPSLALAKTIDPMLSAHTLANLLRARIFGP